MDTLEGPPGLPRLGPKWLVPDSEPEATERNHGEVKTRSQQENREPDAPGANAIRYENEGEITHE